MVYLRIGGTSVACHFFARVTLILLADDQAEVRSALRLLLEHELGLDDIREAGDLQATISCAQHHALDIVILDWELDGAIPQLVAELHRCPGRPRVLAMSGQPQAKAEAFDSGVDAFISKTEAPEVLLDTLRSLLGGAAA